MRKKYSTPVSPYCQDREKDYNNAIMPKKTESVPDSTDEHAPKNFLAAYREGKRLAPLIQQAQMSGRTVEISPENQTSILTDASTTNIFIDAIIDGICHQ